MVLVHYGNSESDDGGWCFVKKKKKRERDISDGRSEAEEARRSNHHLKNS